jgi:hypothetical protein
MAPIRIVGHSGNAPCLRRIRSDKTRQAACWPGRGYINSDSYANTDSHADSDVNVDTPLGSCSDTGPDSGSDASPVWGRE